MALIEKPGRAALDVIAEVLPVIIRTFPWPKSMRWGARSVKSGSLSWVRPLHSIVATFGPETEDPEIVRFEIDGIATGQTTRGHRFMAPDAFSVRRFDDYVSKLEAAKVVLDPERRKDMILADAKSLAFAQGFELVEDQALLDEVAGLVEWPVVLMGSFEESFLNIPGEVIRATIRNNQKCFVVRDPEDRQARAEIHPHRQHRGDRRRQDDHRRQRARDPRAAVGREILLRDRPEDEAGRPAAEVRADRVPREARHAGRAHRAHRAAGDVRLAPLRFGADAASRSVASARRNSARRTC